MSAANAAEIIACIDRSVGFLNWRGWDCIQTDDAFNYAGIGLFLVAAITLMLAYSQFKELAKANKARFLFDLDSRWESAPMVGARVAFNTMYSEIHKEILKADPDIDDDLHSDRIAKSFAEKLKHLKSYGGEENDLPNYHDVSLMVGFFETAGMLVHKKYAAGNDVLDLYLSPCLRVYHAFRIHVGHRGREKNAVPGMYEHAMALGENAYKIAKKRSAANAYGRTSNS